MPAMPMVKVVDQTDGNHVLHPGKEGEPVVVIDRATGQLGHAPKACAEATVRYVMPLRLTGNLFLQRVGAA